MSDPYQILGLSRGATDSEIKSAYRKLAKKYHPDVNQGGSAQSRQEIEQKFKEITTAYDILSDAKKRARYDRGEIDGAGTEKAYGFGGGDPFGGRTRGARSSAGADPFGGGFGFGGMGGMDDFLAEFFGGGRAGSQQGSQQGAQSHQSNQRYSGFSKQSHDQTSRAKGPDITYALNVPFVDACRGGTQRVTLANSKTIDVTIPKGTETGHKLRLRGLGQNGPAGAGDAIIDITVQPHAIFTRKDQDLHLDVPISLGEAVSGAQIKVPTLDSPVMVRVPKGSNSGTILRLKGKGIPAPNGAVGDMFAKLIIALPDPIPQDLAEILEKWSRKNPYDPRQKREG